MASLKNFFIHSFLKKMEKRDAVIADGSYEPPVKNIGNVPNWDEEEYVIEAPIDKLGPIGRWVRSRLLASILIGTPVLVAVQRRRHPLFTKYLKTASLFGTEEFYSVLVCLITWIVDIRLARLCCILMAVGFYFANFLKNSLCLPRPPSPPVQPLENAFHTWALPSHHAVLGVIIPWYIWFYSYLHYNLSTVQYVVLFCVIANWSFSVMFSRIYLGVHSPADVVAGSLVGCLILSVWFRYDDIVDRATAVTAQGAMVVPFYVILMLYIHPRPEIETLSFTESLCMSSVGVGFVLARTMAVGRHPPFKGIIHSGAESVNSWAVLCAFAVVRLLLGGILVLASRVIVKTVMKAIVPGLFRVAGIPSYSRSKTKSFFYTGYRKGFTLPPIVSDKENERNSKETDSKESESSPWDIDIPVRFVTYTAMGYTCNYLAPLAFQYLGIVA